MLTVPVRIAPAAVAGVRHDGVRYRWLLRGVDTAGQLAVAEVTFERGGSSSARAFSREDVVLVVLAGTLRVTIAGTVWHAARDTAMWLPRGLDHHIQPSSPDARALLAAVPAGWDAVTTELGDDPDPAALRDAYQAAGILLSGRHHESRGTHDDAAPKHPSRARRR